MKQWTGLGLLLLLGISLGVSGCGSRSDQSQQASTPPLTPGQQLFLNHCVSCHMGSGNPPGPNAVVLNSSTLSSEESFRELLRHPTSAMMRSFSPDDLSDTKVHDLYVYLQTLKSPQSH